MTASRFERPLKITFLSWRDLAHPQAGGSEVLVNRLATACVQRGHDVALLCGGPVAERPYAVRDIGGEFGQYVRAPLAYHRHRRDSDVIVDVENGVPFFAPLWSRAPVICLVHHVHGPQWRLRFNDAIAAVGWTLESRLMPRAYRRSPFIAMSPSTADGLRQIGVRERAINVMINGVDIAPDAGRARSPEPLFLALGRLVPHKRIDLLLRAWERVRPHTGGRLVVAGDGPELERLRSLAGEGAELRGAIPEDEKARLLSEAWLLVHPAMHEGWGIVVMEAAAHGTPTLAFDVPGVRDAVERGVTGALADDEDGFVRAWLALAADEQRRNAMGRAALARAHAFSWSATTERFDAILHSVVSMRAPSAEVAR